jgi:hypothetical protein
MGRTSLAQLKSRLQSNPCNIVVAWNVVEYRSKQEQKLELDCVDSFCIVLTKRIELIFDPC